MKYDIFISYRRSGGYETAKHLYDLLTREGYSVSFDIDTLRNGDFDKELLKRIDQCTDFILILNKGAFDRTLDPSLDPKKDWLRNELAYALEKGKNIIPIMLSGFTEFPDNLPDDIARVQKKNGPKYDQYYFDSFYEKLKKVFLESRPSAKAANSPGLNVDFKLNVTCDETCRLYIDKEDVGKIKGGKSRVFTQLKPGKTYDLRFESLAVKNDCLDIVYEVPGNKANDSLSVNFAQQRKQKAQEEVENRRRRTKEKDEIYEREGRLRQCLEMYDESHFGTKYEMVAVRKDGCWGFVNMQGFEVIPCKYKEYVEFNEGYCFVMTHDGQWLCFDKDGSELPDLRSEQPSIVHGGLCLVVRKGKYKMKSCTSQQCVNLAYDEIIRTEIPDFIGVRIGDRYIFVNAISGEQMLSSSFDKIYRLGENRKWRSNNYIQTSLEDYKHISIAPLPIPVNNKGKFGYVNSDKKLSIPCVADEIWAEWADRSILKINGKYGLADPEEGRYILPPLYNFIRYWPCTDTDLFSVGIGCATTDDGWRALGGQQGVINSKGKIIVPLMYHDTCVGECKVIYAFKYNNKACGHWDESKWFPSFVWDTQPTKKEEFRFDYSGNPID